MDWKVLVGLVLAIVVLFLNFWWLTAGRKKARLDRDWAADNAQLARFEIAEELLSLIHI